jgi:cbb3-type cytochrome oxidase maturation protein
VSVLYLVVPLAIILAGAAVLAFLWAAKRGQFDDLITPGIRALQDDTERREAGGGERREARVDGRREAQSDRSHLPPAT